ncbi:MAG: pyrroline-5-carboxylate reductase [Gemmataceae bacterium]
MTPPTTRIGFLGAGRMASALARAWIDANLLAADQVLAADPNPAAREAFGLPSTSENLLVVEHSDVLVLAVKPQTLGEVCPEIREAVQRRKPLVISIAAGVPIARLASQLGHSTRLVRVMPNTPCLVAASASAYSPSYHATTDDVALVQRLFEAVGKAVAVPEPLLDAVTGLSGSGPAFVYQFIEALSDGGVRVGLPRDLATMLAAQTVLGAAKMVLETGRHPGQLKDEVTSPGGTTIAGLHELERGGLRGVVMNAVEAAARRASEIGQS